MSERQGKYYLYQIPNDTTLTTLVSEKDSFLKSYNGLSALGHEKIQDFLLITYGGLSNAQRIYSKYTQKQLIENKSKYANSINRVTVIYDFLDIVNSGTELVIPENKVPIELFSIAGKGIFLEQKNIKAFLVDAYKTINNDPQNTPTISLVNGFDVTQLKNNYVSVWMYSKALDKILDVTKFITNLNTSSNTSSGGSFSIVLEGVTDINDSFEQGEEVINIYKVEEFYDKYPQMSYFARWFQQKDMVWIRWEKLDLEKNRASVSNGYEINKSNLKGQIYDMIGLIENVSENSNFSSLDRSVNITGRDLTFLLSEDAAYFYPLLFTDGADSIMINTTEDSKLFKRNILKGGIFEEFFTFMERSISDSIGFVINQLSNLPIVKNDLFSSYDPSLSEDDRLSKRRGNKQIFSITGSGKEDGAYINWQNVEGIWQIIDVMVDDNLNRRRQVDSLLQTSQGTILSMMNSICQQPFVEFMGDTFGDKYVFFARQKIWTKDAIRDFINSNVVIEIEGKDVLNQNLDWETEFYTSYQIEPSSTFLNKDKFTSLCYIPVVFLSKIGEVFGNKPYTQSDSYIDERALAGDMVEKEDVGIDGFQAAIIDDLGYLIEINSYLPFTRKGSITINGDRRIKKGTWIRYKVTGEIFYVDTVSHSGMWSSNTVDRTTTLTVERGMVERYIFPTSVRNNSDKLFDVSYFNIVDSETVKTIMKQTLIGGEIASKDVVKNGNNIITEKSKEFNKTNFDVNIDAFNFFLQRRQFYDKDINSLFSQI